MTSLEKMREQAQYDPSTSFVVDDGYFAVLQMALAREDCATVDAATSVLTRLFPDATSKRHLLLTALREDDPQKIDFNLSSEHEDVVLAAIVFCSERGVHAPLSLITKTMTKYDKIDMFIRCGEIAQALAAGDDAWLARAIDDAEAHHLIVHATRMRIILAQRTGDCTQLERAEPILERLEDRQFLHRLEEVATHIAHRHLHIVGEV